MNDLPRAPLIGVAELGGRLGSPGLLILDCRSDISRPGWGETAWAESHIPGAIHAHLERDLSAPISAGTGRHPLPSAEAFAATLCKWGFTDDSRVVVYDQGSGAIAARLWWMLRARGHRNVRILDGGYAAWLAAGAPVETAATPPLPTRVEPRPFEGMVDVAALQRGLAGGQLRLVDARAADRFAGRNETIDPVPGHVPGAVSHPFARNLGADGRFLAAPALRADWSDTLEGIPPSGLVMMCGSGVTACHNLVALELQGITGARLYPGSYSEWIRDPSRPVATGAG
jgi:thiosulfate/3-mercaptopyruvate sulfurtransferase